MLEKLKLKREELNEEINRKSREFEKTFRKPDKARLHTELKMLEGEYKACVEFIRMMEEENESKF